jgi:Arc/MetJ-type ribon-helix-helix transcriptional regulator
MAVKKESVNLNVQIPVTLRDLINHAIEKDCHTKISEFTRDALRQKIEKDCPEFYHELFKKVNRRDFDSAILDEHQKKVKT